MNFLTAVVPVRQNSERVKNKNFKKFNNENLLIHKINKLKKVGLFDEIIVNTDSDKAIKIAKKLDVSYHKRANFFASSKCLCKWLFILFSKRGDVDLGEFLRLSINIALMISSC